jgi:hypothetical protein
MSAYATTDERDERVVRLGKESLAEYVTRINLEYSATLLPKGYDEYRERVFQWRDKLTEAEVVARMAQEREAAARSEKLRADALLNEARRMDQALRQTEQERGWIRTTAI